MNRLIVQLLMISLLQGCSSVSDTRPEPVRQSEYYLEHGVTAFGNSDYVTATEFFRKALAHYRSIDNIEGIFLSHLNLAETAHAAGNFDAAVENLDAAEAITRREGFTAQTRRIDLLRAQILWRVQQGEAALERITPLLPRFDEDNHPEGKVDDVALTATTLRTAIAFNTLENNPGEARQWLKRLENAMHRSEDSGPLHEARLQRFHARLAAAKGNHTAALETLQEALIQYREAAARPALAATLTEGGRLLISQQRWAEAEYWLQRALYIRLWIMDRIGSHEVLGLLEEVYSQMGNVAKAQEMASERERIRKGAGIEPASGSIEE